jgi:hypothetical protein
MKLISSLAVTTLYLANFTTSNPQFNPYQYGNSQIRSYNYPEQKKYQKQTPSNAPNILENNTNKNLNPSNININSTDYSTLNEFLNAYGLDIGTAQTPSIRSVNHLSNSTMDRMGLSNNLSNNPIQQYMVNNAQLLNKMLSNPNTKYNVGSLFKNPVNNVFGMLGVAANMPSNNGIQNRMGPGLSMTRLAQQQGFSFTIYGLVDFVINFLYNNMNIFKGILGLVISFIRIIPSIIDTVFRIIAYINNLFNSGLIQLILKFLYDYQSYTPPNFFKLTTLIITFMNQDYSISTKVLRDIIALVGKFPI